MTPGKDIFLFIQELEKTEQQVYDLLQKNNEKKSLSWEKTDYARIERILKEIGRGLYNSAKIATGKEDLKFYFWPGYTTVKNKRVLIQGNLFKGITKEERFFTGIGKIGDEEFYDCPSTVFYEALLADLTEEGYYGPTTHNWKRQQDPGTDIRLKKDNSVLRILLIEANQGEKEEEPASANSFCHLQFNSDRPENAIKRIGSELSLLSETLKITGKKEYVPWPLNRQSLPGGRINGRNSELEDVQKLIYPIWFAATFTDKLQYAKEDAAIKDWLNRVKKEVTEHGYPLLVSRLEKFMELEEQLRAKKTNEYKEIFFSHWYTLFFDTKEQKQELGSAMILCEQGLPREYLFFISPWLKHIYGLMRMEEYALRERRNEWRSTFSQLNHNSDFYFTYTLDILRHAFRTKEFTLLPNSIEAVRELSSIIQLSLGFDNIKEYLKNCAITSFDLYAETKRVIKILETDIEHNKGKLLDFSPAQCMAIGNTKPFQIMEPVGEKKSPFVIQTSPELVKVMLKDVLSNAVKNSFKGKKFFPVKIDFSVTNNEVTVEVINKEPMPAEAQEILETGRIDPKSEFSDSLGLIILSRAFENTSYRYKILTEDDGTHFKINFTKKLTEK